MVDTESNTWLQDARRPEVIYRSLRVAALVGSILVLVNQGDVLMEGAAVLELLWKIPLTYCVPYAVSTYAAVDALRAANLKQNQCSVD